jgi:stage V sporulation protein B
VLPIALSSALLPLSRAFDSFLVVNLLQLDKDVATAQYGIYSGGIESLVGVPVALCYGFAVSGIPILSSNKNDDKTLSKLLIYTFVFSAAIAVAVYFLSDFVVNLLYFRLGAEEKTLMSELLRVSAIEIVLLSLLQSLTSSLISLDALSIAPLNLGMGVIVKIVLVLSLVKIPEIGIYGVAISDISCYFVAAIADLLYIICRKKRKARAEKMAV